MINFAYGSNLDPCQIAARCPQHEVIGRALLADFNLCFPRRSPVRSCAVASVEPSPGGHVWGVAYSLCDEDATSLHGYEGYDPAGSVRENRYVLRELRVFLPDQQTHLQAFAYVAVPTANPGLPSAAYLGHMRRGAIHHRLPAEWIEFLNSLPCEP